MGGAVRKMILVVDHIINHRGEDRYGQYNGQCIQYIRFSAHCVSLYRYDICYLIRRIYRKYHGQEVHI